MPEESITRRSLLARWYLRVAVIAALGVWGSAVILGRMAGDGAADALVDPESGVLPGPPVIHLVIGAAVIGLAFATMLLQRLWRIRMPKLAKVALTLIAFGASYGLFMVVTVGGAYAAGVSLDEIAPTKAKR